MQVYKISEMVQAAWFVKILTFVDLVYLIIAVDLTFYQFIYVWSTAVNCIYCIYIHQFTLWHHEYYMNKTKELIYVLISLLPLWLKMLKVNFIFSKCNILEFYLTLNLRYSGLWYICIFPFLFIEFSIHWFHLVVGILWLTIHNYRKKLMIKIENFEKDQLFI